MTASAAAGLWPTEPTCVGSASLCAALKPRRLAVSSDLEDIEMPAVEWEKLSTSEHRARRGGRLVGLVTRPTRGVFWAHRISSSLATDRLEDHGPKTKHRTLAAAKAAIEQSAPPAVVTAGTRRTP